MFHETKMFKDTMLKQPYVAESYYINLENAGITISW